MTTTQLVFRDDPYARDCVARVVAVAPEGGIVLDRTVFYAQGGGQPGDIGTLTRPDGAAVAVANTVYGPDRATILHLPADKDWHVAPGDEVTAALDWARRYARMRVHTALHLLSVVLPYPVTGGAIGEGDGRLDFDIPEAGLDKAELTEKLNALVARDAAVGERWITDAELDANPALVKTMAVKPPRGTGRVRLVEIEGIDLQPCGGTHVRRPARSAPSPSPTSRRRASRTAACGSRLPTRDPFELKGMPMSQPLVSTAWLSERLAAPDIVVVDGSWYLPAMNRDPEAEFVAGHIPGAVRFDIDTVKDKIRRCRTCCRARRVSLRRWRNSASATA